MKEVYQMTKEELFSIYPDVDGLTEEKAKQILKEKGVGKVWFFTISIGQGF